MQFSQVISRPDIKELLLNSVQQGRISHALLFSCNEGSNGLAMAMAYACYIHCENRSEEDSCGVCASCKKHKKLIHPDLHFSYPVVTLSGLKDRSARSSDYIKQWREAILANPYLDINQWYDAMGVENKQGFLSVEESADIQRKLSLKSFEAKYKIQIIWLPEKMRVDASNKLLKILEEPPENTLFILVTEQREQLLPTILSRTQLIRIPALTVREITDALVATLGTEPKIARRVANLADGKISVALSLAGDEEQDFRVEQDFISWMRLCYNPFHQKEDKNSWTDLNAWIDQMAKSGREYQKSFFTFCQKAARECVLSNSGVTELVKFDDEVIPSFSRFSRFIHSGNISGISNLLNRAHYAVERNANARILLLDLSFKMNRLLNQKETVL